MNTTTSPEAVQVAPERVTQVFLVGAPFIGLPDRDRLLENKTALLIAWLAIEGRTPRSRIAALLAPNSSSADAHNALRQRLFRLRRWFDFELVAGNRTLAIADGIQVRLDGDGDLLEGIDSIESPELGAWLERKRHEHRIEQSQRRTSGSSAVISALNTVDVAAPPLDAAFTPQSGSNRDHANLMRLHFLRGEYAQAAQAAAKYRAAIEQGRESAPQHSAANLLTLIERNPEPALQANQGRLSAATHERTAALHAAARLATPRLIGRVEAWTVIDEAWRQGRSVVIEGPCGIGKTSLLREFAQSRGNVPVVAALPGDSEIAYALIKRIVRAMLDRVGEPSSAMRHDIAQILPEFGEPGTQPAPARRGPFMHALSQLARAASEAGMDGMVIDDLHHADSASIETLPLLNARSDLSIAIASRPEALSPTARAFVDRTLNAHHGALVRLGPLSAGQSVELLASLTLDDAHLHPWTSHAGGSPLLLLQMAYSDRLEVLPGVPIEAPTEAAIDRSDLGAYLHALIAPRLALLTSGALRLAHCAAVAQCDFTPALACEILGLNPARYESQCAELESTGVFEIHGLPHELVGTAVRECMPDTLAQQFHAAIADALESHHGEAVRIAFHWRRADEVTRAIRWFAIAADTAHQALRPRERTQMLLQAADLAYTHGDGEQAFDYALAALDGEPVADRHEDLHQICSRLDAFARTDRQRAQVGHARAWLALDHNEFDESERLARNALSIALAVHDAPLAARLQQLLGATFAASMRDLGRAARHMADTQPQIQQHGSARERAVFHSDYGVILSHHGRLLEAHEHFSRSLEIATQIGDTTLARLAHRQLALNYRYRGEPRHALEELGAAESSAEDSIGPMVEDEPAILMRTKFFCDLAWFDEALSCCARIAQDRPESSIRSLVSAADSEAACWIQLGQFARAQRSLQRSAATQAEQGHVQARHLLIQARLQRALNQPSTDRIDRALACTENGALLYRHAVLIEKTWELPADEAMAVLDEIIAETQRLHQHGLLLEAHVRAAGVAVKLDTKRAVDHARTALEMGHLYEPTDFYRAELWLNAARAFDAAGDEGAARETLAQGIAWVRKIADEHVPAPFRDSFLHRNPINRTLLTLGTRAQLH